MSGIFVNRRGDQYHVFEGQTKTGKVKYFASKKLTSKTGKRIDSLPDDFEFFENPANAVVTVRRRKPSRVLDEERELVERLTLELSACSHVQTIINGDEIVIYTPDQDFLEPSTRATFGLLSPGMLTSLSSRSNFSAQMRFTLINPKSADGEERSWEVDRFCYRGAIDDWFPIGDVGPLETQARTFVKHLGRESFFELM